MTAPTAVWCAHTWRDTTPCTTSAAGHRCRRFFIHQRPCRCYCGAEKGDR